MENRKNSSGLTYLKDIGGIEMKYEVALNTLTETRGKYHLRPVNPNDSADSEKKAHRDRQTFDSLPAAESHCKWINSYYFSGRKQIQVDSGI